MEQKCNLCWRPLSGTVCKTSCCHLFCEDCAVKHFTQYDRCPVCNEYLNGNEDGTFQEILVGVTSNSLIDSMYQASYSEPDHQHISDQMLWCLHSCREVLQTHLAQTFLEIQKQKQAVERTESRRIQETKATNELKQRCANLEHKVQDLERRNARLERRNGELDANYKNMSQTAESYRLHYEGLKGKASTPSRMGGGAGIMSNSLDMSGSMVGMMMAPAPRGPSSRSSSTSSRDNVRIASFNSRSHSGSDRGASPSPSRSFMQQHRSSAVRLGGGNSAPSPLMHSSSMGRALFASGRSMASGFVRHGPSVM